MYKNRTPQGVLCQYKAWIISGNPDTVDIQKLPGKPRVSNREYTT
jgi:hypothetical protein